MADAIREARSSKFLCIMVAINSVQIILTAVIGARLASLRHDTIIVGKRMLEWKIDIIEIYLSLGIILSCMGARLWKSIKGDLDFTWLLCPCHPSATISVYLAIFFFGHEEERWHLFSTMLLYFLFIICVLSVSSMEIVMKIVKCEMDEEAAPAPSKYLLISAWCACGFIAAFLIASIVILVANPVSDVYEHLSCFDAYSRLLFADLHAAIFAVEIWVALLCNVLSLGSSKAVTAITSLVMFLKSLVIIVAAIEVTPEPSMRATCLQLITLTLMLYMGVTGVLSGFVLILHIFLVH